MTDPTDSALAILANAPPYNHESAARAAYNRYVEAVMQPYREAFLLWLITKEGDMPLMPMIFNFEYWREASWVWSKNGMRC